MVLLSWALKMKEAFSKEYEPSEERGEESFLWEAPVPRPTLPGMPRHTGQRGSQRAWLSCAFSCT